MPVQSSVYLQVILHKHFNCVTLIHIDRRPGLPPIDEKHFALMSV